MALKTFIEADGLKLVSDERDVMVPAKYFSEVLEWCELNNIDVTQPAGSYRHWVANSMFKVNLWRIKDVEQRIMFILRWS